MKVSECKDKLRVGMKVWTDGCLVHKEEILVTGIIGEIKEDKFYVWQNKREGARGDINPKSKGYQYSWCIYFDNKEAEIEILEEGNMFNLENALKEVDGAVAICEDAKKDVKNILRALCENKKEEKNVFYIGDIVRTLGKVCDMDLKNMVGKVVCFRRNDPANIGVEFTERICDGYGHSCDGHGKNFYCRYGKPEDFELVYRSPK